MPSDVKGILFALGVGAVLLAGYGLALIHEPQAYWFWHTILGVVQ